MKKINCLMLFAAAAIAFGSCSRNDENESVTPEKAYAYSFNLSVAQTKAVLGDKAIEYEAGDKIGVFVGGSSQSEGVVDVEKSPVVVEFKTDKALAAGETLYAYYPYAAANSSATAATVTLTIPEAQVQTGTSYDADAMPMAAIPYTLTSIVEEGATKAVGDIYMCNLASVVEFNVYSADAAGKKIQYVSFESETALAGNFITDLTAITDDMAADRAIEGLASTAVTVSVNSSAVVGTDKENATKIYMVVAPGQHKGVVKVKTEDAIYTFPIETAVNFQRAHVKPLGLNLATASREASIKLAWSYKLGEGVKMEALHPAVDANGNVYITQTGTNLLYKIGPDGNLVWKIAMEGADESTFEGQLSVASLEKDGSVVYAGGGSTSGTGAFYAFNAADGSLKWDFNSNEFWASAGTPKPSVNRVNAAVGEKYIYIGNGGTTGTAIAIDKATGERAAYVSNKTNGTGGPAGGCNVGVSVSKSGLALFRAGYGTFSFETSLVGGTDYVHETFGGFVPYSAQYRDGTLTTRNGNIACFTLDGQDYFTLFGATNAGMSVIWAPITAGADLAYYFTGNSTQTWTTHEIKGAQKQDQGGLVIGARNEIIVALKHNANVPGGVYAIDPATNTMAWKYEVGAEVGGTPAVDKAGNVHILDDYGMYYIVKPDYANKTATLVAKTSLFELYKETGHVFNEGDRCKAFTTPIIGTDGRMYNAVYFRDSSKAAILSAVMCLEYEGCQGYGDTPWPLKNADCYNSGHQLK